MWSFLAYPIGPKYFVVNDLAPAFGADLNMTGLLRSIFMHPEFVSATARQGLVKQPIEWVAGLMRSLNLHTKTFHKQGGAGYLLDVLSNLGQIPFNPPTVGGWGSNQYWLSSASSLTQLNFAQTITQVADLSVVEEASGTSRVDALGTLLGIDSWSPKTNAILQHVRDDLNKLVPLALTAPETIAN